MKIINRYKVWSVYCIYINHVYLYSFYKMKISIKYLSLLSTLLLTASCSMIEESSTRLCANDEGDFYQCKDINLIAKKEGTQDSNLFKPGTNFQKINEYTEQMVHVLYQKVSLQNIEKAIAVPPFISLPYTKNSNQQLNVSVAEAFAVDMQNIGFPVAEFILTNASENEQTNFISYIEELAGSQHFGYILKGTMREREQGIMIHAKIIDVETKKVIASTSKFLPKYLVNLF
jgi:TolB-like protein